jgi:hypothetical protein
MSKTDPMEGTYIPAEAFLHALAGQDDLQTPVMAEALRLAASVLEITEDYDVRCLSPAQMGELARRLYEAGAIGAKEFALMSFRRDLLPEYAACCASYLKLGEEPDRPRDFVAAWGELLEEIRSRHPDPEMIHLVAQIADLLESFEPIEDLPELPAED